MNQHAFTALTEIRDGQVKALSRLLTAIGDDPPNNSYIPFSNVQGLHFASWTILAGDGNYPPLLVFEASYDGDLDTLLDELLVHGLQALNQIYSFCKDCPFSGTSNVVAFKRYLSSHNHRPASFFVGLPDQTVLSIKNAIQVRTAVARQIDSQRREALQGRSAAAIWHLVNQYFQEVGVPPPRPSPVSLEDESRIEWRNTLLAKILFLPVLLCLWPVLAADLLAIRLLELREERQVPTERLAANRTFDETNNVQNHMVTVVEIKPGLIRLWTLKAVLWFFGFAGGALQRSGAILGISTIHFVRWILIDDERRLLFLANYDGRWAAYLGDFIDCASFVLTAIWSNTKNFPPSKWLFWQGARRAEEFRQWTRDHNLQSLVWYSAYPDSTVRNLRKDISIRDGLASGVSSSEVEQLLLLL